MRLNRRDYFIIGLILVLLAALSLGSRFGKGKPVPKDRQHRSVFDDLRTGRTRSEVELLCTTCHSESTRPLPKGHPPKEQCLICHKLEIGTR